MLKSDGKEGAMVKLSEKRLGNFKVSEVRKVEATAAQGSNGKSKEWWVF